MLLRQGASLFLKNANRRCQRSVTSFSTTTELVSTSIDPTSGVAHLTMQNGPVNSLSLEMCQAIEQTIKDIERDSRIEALVLQSNSPTIFSAGLDLMELHNPSIDRLDAFWRAFQNVYFALYGSRLACIAAIEGHAPAAGCILAMCCDYRIMSSSTKDVKPTIGLNESKLGLGVRPWFGQQLIDTIGRRQAELSMSLGTLYTAEEALAINLVDSVVSKDKVRDEALQEALKWSQIPAKARVANKQIVRQERLEKLRVEAQEDANEFVEFVTNSQVQHNLNAYLELLVKRKSKK